MRSEEVDWELVYIDTLSRISDSGTMSVFLSDVMTQKELQEISARLQAAVMLEQREKYTDISAATGLSSRTVARISEWLKRDSGGYSTAIELVKKHHLHM